MKIAVQVAPERQISLTDPDARAIATARRRAGLGLLVLEVPSVGQVLLRASHLRFDAFLTAPGRSLDRHPGEDGFEIGSQAGTSGRIRRHQRDPTQRCPAADKTGLADCSIPGIDRTLGMDNFVHFGLDEITGLADQHPRSFFNWVKIASTIIARIFLGRKTWRAWRTSRMTICSTLRDYRYLHPAAGEQAEEPAFHHAPQSRCRLLLSASGS
jgi:hypothetical protein